MSTIDLSLVLDQAKTKPTKAEFFTLADELENGLGDILQAIADDTGVHTEADVRKQMLCAYAVQQVAKCMPDDAAVVLE